MRRWYYSCGTLPRKGFSITVSQFRWVVIGLVVGLEDRLLMICYSGASKLFPLERVDITGQASSSSRPSARPRSTGPGWRRRTRPGGRLTSPTGTLPPSGPARCRTPSLLPLLLPAPPASLYSPLSSSSSTSAGGYRGHQVRQICNFALMADLPDWTDRREHRHYICFNQIILMDYTWRNNYLIWNVFNQVSESFNYQTLMVIKTIFATDHQH